jgi:Flp pilus assembly pilin Flp
MKLMNKMIKFLRDDESGAVTLEYVAIAVVVGALAVSAISFIRKGVSQEASKFKVQAAAGENIGTFSTTPGATN